MNTLTVITELLGETSILVNGETKKLDGNGMYKLYHLLSGMTYEYENLGDIVRRTFYLSNEIFVHSLSIIYDVRVHVLRDDLHNLYNMTLSLNEHIYHIFHPDVDALIDILIKILKENKKMKITRTIKAIKYVHHETGDVEYLSPDASHSEVARLLANNFSYEGEVTIKLTATNQEFMKIATIKEV